MNETKIQFSGWETEMMCNADIILTKNRILEKVRLMLEVLQEQLIDYKFPSDLAPVFSIPPKISRGENYEGLPYLILDYPRFFKPENIFAIRTMFWWGNFFSTTLHLSGPQKLRYAPVIEANSALLVQNHFYAGVSADPWAHHFEESNYQVIREGRKILALAQPDAHLKLATKISLEQWPLATDIMVRNWKLLMEVCGLVATDPVK